MISALVDLLGNFYQSGNLAQVEVIAHTIRTVIPDDVLSLQVLGLTYLQSGRTSDAHELLKSEVVNPEAQIAQLEQAAQGEGTQTHCELASSVCIREATVQGPGFAKVWVDLGEAFDDVSRPKQSRLAFRVANIASGTSTVRRLPRAAAEPGRT